MPLARYHMQSWAYLSVIYVDTHTYIYIHICIYMYLQFLSFRNIEMGKVAQQYIKNGPQGCRLMQIFGPFCSEVCPGKMTEDPLTDEPDCIANNVSVKSKWGTFYLHELSLIPACISNHTLRNVWVK